MGTRNKRRGRPPKELELSEDAKELLSASISHLREAADLLAVCEADPVLQRIKEADRLSYNARKEIAGIIKHNDNLGEALEEFNEFIEERVEFAKNAREIVKTLYDAYVEWCGVEESDIKEGLAFSRLVFTKTLSKKYKDEIYVSVQRVNGGDLARCFIGLRLKKLEAEAENDG
jgi:DNA repair ATPase RecN